MLSDFVLALCLCCYCWMEIKSASICISLELFMRWLSWYWLFFIFQSSDGLMVYTFVALVHWWFFVNLTSKLLDTGSTLFLSLSPDWCVESKFALQKKCLSQQIPLIPWNCTVLFPTALNKLEPRCHCVSHRNRCDATANYLIPERFLFWASRTKFSSFSSSLRKKFHSMKICV